MWSIANYDVSRFCSYIVRFWCKHLFILPVLEAVLYCFVSDFFSILNNVSSYFLTFLPSHFENVKRLRSSSEWSRPLCFNLMQNSADYICVSDILGLFSVHGAHARLLLWNSQGRVVGGRNAGQRTRCNVGGKNLDIFLKICASSSHPTSHLTTEGQGISEQTNGALMQQMQYLHTNIQYVH